jgi:hypothetical protein
MANQIMKQAGIDHRGVSGAFLRTPPPPLMNTAKGCIGGGFVLTGAQAYPYHSLRVKPSGTFATSTESPEGTST